MNEVTKPVTRNPLPPITARTIEYKKVYALLYRAYIRSQIPKNGKLLSPDEENTHE